MTLLWIVAVAAFALALFLLFVWPVVFYGPSELRRMAGRPEPRLLAGLLASLVIVATMGPLVTAALISGGETVQLFAGEFSALSFGR